VSQNLTVTLYLLPIKVSCCFCCLDGFMVHEAVFRLLLKLLKNTDGWEPQNQMYLSFAYRTLKHVQEMENKIYIINIVSLK